MTPAFYYPVWLVERCAASCPIPEDQIVAIETLGTRVNQAYLSALVEVTPLLADERDHKTRHYVLIHSIAGVQYLGTKDTESLLEFISYYLWVCEENSFIAISIVGLAFLKGIGPFHSPLLARMNLLEASESGLSFAQVGLAHLYSNGIGGEKNYETAAHWLQKAALQGNPEGQLRFALILLEGKGVEQSRDDAIVYLFKAALQGHKVSAEKLQHLADVELEGEAQFAMAILWRNGLVPGHHKNIHKERSYLEKAARNRVEAAIALLEALRPSHRLDPLAIAKAFQLRAGKRCATECCYHHAQQNALDSGFSCFEKKDFTLAKFNFVNAAPGHPYAYYMLGIMALHGLGEDQNLEKARHFFLFSISGGCLYGILPLTKILWEEGDTQDKVEARKFLQIGAQAGTARVQGKLALDYFWGIGGEPDYTLACHWVLEAHKNGDSGTLVQIGFTLATNAELRNNDLAFQCFKLAAESRRPDALYYLGQCHLKGIGTQVDLPEAKRCFAKSARLGYSDASIMIEQLSL